MWSSAPSAVCKETTPADGSRFGRLPGPFATLPSEIRRKCFMADTVHVWAPNKLQSNLCYNISHLTTAFCCSLLRKRRNGIAAEALDVCDESLGHCWSLNQTQTCYCDPDWRCHWRQAEKTQLFHTYEQEEGESSGTKCLRNMNNRTCPCEEMSFHIYNYKHTELIITKSFSYASCCFVVCSTQFLLPFFPPFLHFKDCGVLPLWPLQPQTKWRWRKTATESLLRCWNH